ncbi:hypothetical protein AAG570_005652 [Ranatra chinensis]|uniref:Trehalose-6-phosphate synthase n=1 Tax=Ranatra chinensis TaxID=642074 RepID=A0ABD0XZ10_9HEMI
MGFFLHTPFPQWEVFRLIPWANLMLQGILECDVIGFNAKRYCLNFMDCCRESLGCKIDVDSGTVIHVGRTIKVVHNPIGVSNRDLENLARESPDLELSKNLVILGVDRLDYIRGVPYKLNAFERFLEMYPEFLEKVVLLQILIPSRTSQAIYQELKKTIDKLVGRINGKFGTHDWVPIQYIYKFILPKELAGYYRDSHVYFFTPLSDGMNLRGKEYVASQIKSSPGVLIMSQFSGAEEEMKEALFCNPHDITETAETLKRGLTMSEDERVLRMNNLRRRGKKYDIQYWKENFMKAMNNKQFKWNQMEQLIQFLFAKRTLVYYSYCEFEKKDKLALVLDYEGTMVPILENGEVEKLPAKTKQLIEKLSSYKDVHLTIISEGDIENLKKLIGCDNIIYAGHNGLQINIPNGTKFTHIELTNLHKKISSLAVSLKKNTSTSKATIINKGCYLIFNYQNIPEELQEYTVQVAGGIIKKNKFEVTPGPKCLYARLRLGWSKGRAVIFILTQIFGYDWDDNVKVIYAGNDQNDEEVFRVNYC